MRASMLFWLAAASAAGYAAARRLMAMDEAALGALPEPVRGPASTLREPLLGARASVASGWREGVEERDGAQRDLIREYERRSGHS
ncbi:MAG: hypothetical protein EXR64_06285 [Dehalococcoidia bacterium]|nr:hypothetical protein [Dehalococcoidia bacterium]